MGTFGNCQEIFEFPKKYLPGIDAKIVCFTPVPLEFMETCVSPKGGYHGVPPWIHIKNMYVLQRGTLRNCLEIRVWPRGASPVFA